MWTGRLVLHNDHSEVDIEEARERFGYNDKDVYVIWRDGVPESIDVLSGINAQLNDKGYASVDDLGAAGDKLVTALNQLPTCVLEVQPALLADRMEVYGGVRMMVAVPADMPVRDALDVVEPVLSAASSAGKTITRLVSAEMTAANGDAAKARALACDIAEAAALLPVRDWQSGMTTQPGDLVRAPDGGYVYAYSGAAALTHANPTFYPGAAGVYYWAIVPDVHEGCKVYPDVPGIIVAVRQGEVWWTSDKAKRYRWTGADNNACNWYPGQAGVHQWALVE